MTKSGHRITMVDTPGKETVSIATLQHNRLMLTEQHQDTGRSAIVFATAGDLILYAPNGRIHSRSATHSREVGVPAVTFDTSASDNLQNAVQRSGESASAPISAKQTITAPTAAANGTNTHDNLCLGVNDKYADNIRAAANRTSIDPAALASFVNAEAAKDKDGVWNADSAAATSTAKSFTQFLSRTWQGMAKTPGTLLAETAVGKGFVSAGTKGSYSIVPSQANALDDLRTDPQLSLTTGAEYLKHNLNYLHSNNLIPADATDDEKAQLGYIAHHEGPSGAVNLLNGTLPEDRAQTLMNANMTASTQQKYLAANGNNKAAAYKAWLADYAKEKVVPDNYRCDKLNGNRR